MYLSASLAIVHFEFQRTLVGHRQDVTRRHIAVCLRSVFRQSSSTVDAADEIAVVRPVGSAIQNASVCAQQDAAATWVAVR